jgi:hypothetical protein
MKKLFLFGAALVSGLAAQAQVFTLPTSTEKVAPSITGSPASSGCNFTNTVTQLSNADYESTLAGWTLKIAGWSNGSSGGFTWGYDDPTLGLSFYGAQAIGGIDVQAAIMENTVYGAYYGVVAYYNPSTSSYVCQLYSIAPSSATLLFTKTLATTTYNRLSMDVSSDGRVVAFAWSDGNNVFGAVGKVDATSDALNFSASLPSPGIQLTNGSSLKTLPDVAFAGISAVGGIDSVYFAYHDDSVSQVHLLKANVSDMYYATTPSLSMPVRDYNNVSSKVAVELDAPGSTTWGNVWAYTYVDSYVKVRHRARSFGPVTATINNGSLPVGPAAMSVTGMDLHPVIAYTNGADAYSVGWTTTRSTNPYAYPHGMAMVHVMMSNYGFRDSLITKKDYQLINAFPGASSTVYVPPVLSFAQRGGLSADRILYTAYARITPAAAPWAELVHKNHSHNNFTSFRLAEPAVAQQLSVAPNPSSRDFQLLLPAGMDTEEQIALTLTDMTGRTLLRATGNSAAVNTQLATVSAGLPSGSYVIATDCAGAQQSFKVQKIAQ